MARLSPTLDWIYDKLNKKESLDDIEMAVIMESLMDGGLDDDQIARFLKSLREKGETVTEIVSAARVMKKHAIKPFRPIDGLLDTCGTGADNQHTVNVSTLTALIASSLDVPVAKHGNRSISSVCGSADLLELLGIKIDLSIDRIEEEMAALNFGFFFAPLHHPAAKIAGPARKKLQGKTIFNLLGPLSNPAEVTYQLLGVYDKKLLYPMAEALHELAVLKALVVYGEDGMDEITLCGETRGAWLEPNGEIRDITITPESAGLERVSIEKLRCHSKAACRDDARKILNGAKGPKTDFVLLNAGAALWLTGKAGSHQEGVLMAREALESGRTLKQVQKIAEFSNKPEKK